MNRRLVTALLLAAAAETSAIAQTATTPRAVSTPSGGSSVTPLERRASLSLDSVRNSPLELRLLLFKMPKGSDLHNHLYGAVSAETWIKDAVEDGMCLDPSAIRGTAPVFSTGEGQPPACPSGKIPSAEVLKNQHLYDDLINAFSMRSFVPTPGISGHDHFFNTFARFNGVSEKHLAEWVDEVASRAARQNVQYIELMHTPTFGRTAAASYEIGWQDDLARFRDA